MNAHLPLDTRRTPLAQAMHTQRLALSVICAAGGLVLIHLAAWFIQ